MFEHFQKYIEKAAQNRGISKELKAINVCHAFRKIIPQIFQNKEAINNIDAASYRETYLVLNVSSPAWAQEVMMKKQEIIDAVNSQFPTTVIKNLRTQQRKKTI